MGREAERESDGTDIKAKIQDLSAVADPNRLGVLVTPLYKNEREEVRIEEWEADTEVMIDAPNGAELLVLEGSFTEGKDRFITQSWLRVPVNSVVVAQAGRGARVWLKTGHLQEL